MSRAELRGLAPELRRTVPDLTRLNVGQTRSLQQVRALASCQNEVLLPFAKTPIPHPYFKKLSGEAFYEQSPRSLVGLAGESRLSDANTPFFRTQAGGGPTTLVSPGVLGEDLYAQLDFPLQGIAPLRPERQPAFRPDVPCETQEPPNLVPVSGGPGDAGETVEPSGRSDASARLTDRLEGQLGRALRPPRPGRRRPEVGRPAGGPGRQGRQAMRRLMHENVGNVVAIVLLLALGVGVAGYILLKQGVRFPFIEKGPFALHVEFTNARGVNPGQGQTVRVAGMRVGDIGAVELRDGLAVVRMDLDPEFEGLVRRDATALLRPRTGLKDMFLELDPGTRAEPALEENAVIDSSSTAPDINADEVLSALDSDSRAYLRLLLTGAGKGLAGRGGDLREVFRRLSPLLRDVKRLNTAVATRRRNLERLVANTSSTVTELATRDDELARLVGSSNRVFRAIGSRPEGVSEAVRRLAPDARAGRTGSGHCRAAGPRAPVA